MTNVVVSDGHRYWCLWNLRCKISENGFKNV